MEVSPALALTRFEKLNPGDLFLSRHSNGFTIALVVTLNPIADDAKLIFPLGPTFSPDAPIASVVPPPPGRFCVLSFGAQYTLRLPIRADAWTTKEPQSLDPCVLVAEDGTYLRANFLSGGRCHVRAKDGRILATTQGYPARFEHPLGECLYALRWEIVTVEDPPRTILSYPFEVQG